MLQHEQTDPSAVSPAIPPPVPNAADARVTPDELNAALKALEDRQSSTVAIGSVVDELRLNATPEEIWAQVQKQRAGAAPKPQTQAVPPVQTQQIGRQVRRGWHGMPGWIWILFWCSGGFGLLAGGAHLVDPGTSSAGISISGDRVTGSYNVQGTGPQRDVSVSGDHDKITLHGEVRHLNVEGNGNTVTVIGSVEGVTVDSDDNTIHWTKELPGKAVRPEVSGDRNIIGQSAP